MDISCVAFGMSRSYRLTFKQLSMGPAPNEEQIPRDVSCLNTKRDANLWGKRLLKFNEGSS